MWLAVTISPRGRFTRPDGGATWTTVDTYQANSGNGAAAYGLGSDTAGNIYVLGSARENIKQYNTGHWIVRRSSNGGNSWTTVDDFLLTASGNCQAHGFIADSLGNLFVVGIGNMNLTPSHWIVRENPGGTGNWTTVDDFQYVSDARGHAITANGFGNVFVGGRGNASDGVHWLVRKK